MSLNRTLADWIPNGTPTAEQFIGVDNPVTKTSQWETYIPVPTPTAEGQVLVAGPSPNFDWELQPSIDSGRY